MSDLAIDIALLPPSRVMDRAIALNSEYPSRFALNKENCLPHITLCQAVVKDGDLQELKDRVQGIASHIRQPLELRAYIVVEPETMFAIEHSDQLQHLHESIMDGCGDLVSHDNVNASCFYDKVIRDKSLAYVKHFSENAAYNKYYPHITLGIDEHVSNYPDFSFTASRLTVCHLGNFNTCRKILLETRLGTS